MIAGIMRLINFSDAGTQFKQTIDQVVEDAEFTVIAKRDAQSSVLMSLDTHNSLMETLHLMKSPADIEHLGRFTA